MWPEKISQYTSKNKYADSGPSMRNIVTETPSFLFLIQPANQCSRSRGTGGKSRDEIEGRESTG
jgi:hypothetical protein